MTRVCWPRSPREHPPCRTQGVPGTEATPARTRARDPVRRKLEKVTLHCHYTAITVRPDKKRISCCEWIWCTECWAVCAGRMKDNQRNYAVCWCRYVCRSQDSDEREAEARHQAQQPPHRHRLHGDCCRCGIDTIRLPQLWHRYFRKIQSPLPIKRLSEGIKIEEL